MKRASVLGALVVILLGMNARVNADEEKPEFKQGSFSLDTAVYYAGDFNGHHEKLSTFTIGGGMYVFDRISLSLEMSGRYIDQPGNDAGAWGTQLHVRQHLLVLGPVSLLGDVALGIEEATHNVPPGGTRFDYTIGTGPGLTYRLREHVYLEGGVHYFHLSNARMHSGANNPSINGIQGYFGVLFNFD